MRMGADAARRWLFSPARPLKTSREHLREPQGQQCNSPLAEASLQRESHLEGFDGMEYVCEFRCACWRDSKGVGVVDVVIVTIEQVEKLGREAPLLVNVISNLCIEQEG